MVESLRSRVESQKGTHPKLLALDSLLLALDSAVLGVCRIRTRPREGRGPGPIPGEDTYWTLEPDGEATGCNPVEVGSTPTGVFYRKLQARFDVAGPAARGAPYQRLAPRVPDMESSESDVESTTFG